MSRTTLIILSVLALAFAAITGLAVRRGILGPQPQTVAIGGPFHLVDQTGRPADQRLLKGKWSAVFFGFTQCPEACPTTLLALRQTETLLGDRSKAFQTVFISVDPTRDTPKVLANFLNNAAFPRATVGLTGTDAQVAAAAGAYHVFYQKAGTGPDYTVNHSTITYLMGPRGNFVCLIPYGAPPQVMADKIGAAMKAGAGADSC
jgi:protein SCO1/2